MWSANATNNFIPQNLTTCFGPYGPSSRDNYRNDVQYMLFRRFSFYCNTSIIFVNMRLIYCNFILYVYIAFASLVLLSVSRRILEYPTDRISAIPLTTHHS
jgi:hypothetical protein